MIAKKKKNRRSRNGASIVAARQKESKSLELRLRGYTFDQIAPLVGYPSASGPRTAVNRALERMVDKEDIEQYRSLQLARYERFWKKHYADWRKAEDAETRERIVKVLMNIALRIEKVAGLSKDVTMNFMQNNLQVNSYTVVEDTKAANVDPQEFELPILDPLARLQEQNGNGHANGNGVG